jgi:hypothetical protein
MTADPLARAWTIPYENGAYTDAFGNLTFIFGEDFANTAIEPVQTTYQRDSYPRVRVIGEPATQVRAHTVDYQRWPSTKTGGAAGGNEIRWWDEEDNRWRTGRVHGTYANFNQFLTDNMELARFEYRTARGTRYMVGDVNEAEEQNNG